ncbi:MAG TPA: transposase [Accumulibacter sp.]|uniref:transposase n=1 Tax=Accumulibacter sp. TaxID=2053492 RepID=UPI0014861ED0|nr:MULTISPECIES: transposase [Candidatus Accumulibacter]MBN8518404.1 transposase [Accumulibacter sp.]MBO3711379.1 transposase [Accumulibacter sp.]MCM8578373.1 transposase [Accumulibacter sp.]HNF92370.1 transposase [Accumulibacter sp.]
MFSTELFKRSQHSEQGCVLVRMEMVVQGVSTRKVSAITEELCGASLSKSTVSALRAGLDVRVRAFNERRLAGDSPFLLADPLFLKSREDDRVVQRAALILSGIRSDGHREILGVQIGDSESFATWDETFRWLKGCGLKGVMFVVSDEYGGLTQAIAKPYQGATSPSTLLLRARGWISSVRCHNNFHWARRKNVDRRYAAHHALAHFATSKSDEYGRN